jgi:hypothetical protein
MKPLINYSEASRILTGNKESVRSNYNRKKYKEAVRELKGFEIMFRAKYENKSKT